jgi:hypothetical protein
MLSERLNALSEALASLYESVSAMSGRLFEALVLVTGDCQNPFFTIFCLVI